MDLLNDQIMRKITKMLWIFLKIPQKQRYGDSRDTPFTRGIYGSQYKVSKLATVAYQDPEWICVLRVAGSGSVLQITDSDPGVKTDSDKYSANHSSAIQAACQSTFISMHNYTPLVISGNDKNKQLTLLSQSKLALTGINTLFALFKKTSRVSY
jgi:hypothetical protein